MTPREYMRSKTDLEIARDIEDAIGWLWDGVSKRKSFASRGCCHVLDKTSHCDLISYLLPMYQAVSMPMYWFHDFVLDFDQQNARAITLTLLAHLAEDGTLRDIIESEK